MRSTCFLALLALLGCSRTIPAGPGPTTGDGGSTGMSMSGGATGTGGGGGAAPGVPPDAGPTLPPEADLPGQAPFARLTSLEYRNTLRDLLGITGPDVVPSTREFDSGQRNFATGVGRGPQDVDRILRIASWAAERAAQNLPALLPCVPLPAAAAEQEACARQFIAGFGLRAYRRPLDDAEQTALLELYRKVRGPEGQADFSGAIRLLIEAMLQSPYFLYRWEVTLPLVKDGALVRFGAYEMASRLSYGLWATMPDDQLFAEAAANRLSAPDDLERQARRMLADPRAASMVADFHVQLVRADDLPDRPSGANVGFSAELGRSMVAETAAVTSELIVGPGARGTLEELLGSSSTIVDSQVALIYGMALPAMGRQRVMLSPGQRAGILTQAAFLTANSRSDEPGVVARGLRVLEQFLCQELPPPPADVPPPDPPPPGPATTRERHARHAMSPCAECHLKIDPLGFAFLNYDSIGRYRLTEPDFPDQNIDASGELKLPSGTLQWRDGVDLARKLASIEEVRACMGKQWFRYLMHRKEGPGDERSLRLAREAFGPSYTLKELIVGLTRTRSFTHRTPSPGEVLP
jgi:hypothetical protein